MFSFITVVEKLSLHASQLLIAQFTSHAFSHGRRFPTHWVEIKCLHCPIQKIYIMDDIILIN